MDRQPHPDDPAYRDKKTNELYKQRNNPRRPTEGELLRESGDFLQDPEEEDLSIQQNYADLTVPNAGEEGETLDAWPNVKQGVNQSILQEGGKWALIGLQKFGEGVDWVGDHILGIPGTDIDLYHARRKLIDPLEKQGFALGLLGEILLPDALDVATLGLSYIPRKFIDAGIEGINLWAKITKQSGKLNTQALDELLAAGKFDEADKWVKANFGQGASVALHTGEFDVVPLSQRMSDAVTANKQAIRTAKRTKAEEIIEALRKQGIDEAAAADTGLDAIKLAKVNKQRIRRYVEEFGGTEADVQRIMKEQILKDKNIDQSRTWLNKYFNKLTEYLDEDGKTLHEFAIKNVDGKPRLVEVATGELRRAFEKDHAKARNIFKKLADASDDPELFAGADFHENLENVYTVFNRLKSDRPPIPDEISRAIGQSTSLREFVQRRLDETFNESMIQIPRAFRPAAKIRMLDSAQNSIPIKGKPKKLLKRIVEEEKALWKWLTPIMEAADRAPKDIQKQLDEFANSTNPVKDYEYIKGLIEKMDLDPAFVKRHKQNAENWIQMLQRSRRGGIPGGPDLHPGMFADD